MKVSYSHEGGRFAPHIEGVLSPTAVFDHGNNITGAFFQDIIEQSLPGKFKRHRPCDASRLNAVISKDGIVNRGPRHCVSHKVIARGISILKWGHCGSKTPQHGFNCMVAHIITDFVEHGSNETTRLVSMCGIHLPDGGQKRGVRNDILRKPPIERKNSLINAAIARKELDSILWFTRGLWFIGLSGPPFPIAMIGRFHQRSKFDG
mmetsp:Transcript_8225/g.17498  ORF Transcript_8225/g.17498 Transcript_8225/m.17498 type:complete len:206 (+) Transcript_8225:1182-1799(+)